MDAAGAKYIKDLRVKYPKLNCRRFTDYADIESSHRVMEAILEDSEALGMTADDFMRNLLGRKKQSADI